MTFEQTLSEAVRMLFSPELCLTFALMCVVSPVAYETGLFVGYPDFRDAPPPTIQLADISQYSFRGGFGD